MSCVPWVNWLTMAVSVAAVIVSRRYALMARRSRETVGEDAGS